MAINPVAPGAGTYRVVRLHAQVTETYVVAGSAAAARDAAKALPAKAWKTRNVIQRAGEDPFEYNTVASDL